MYIKSYGKNLVNLLGSNSNAAASFGIISKDASGSSAVNDVFYLKSGIDSFVIDSEHELKDNELNISTTVRVSETQSGSSSLIPLKVSNMLIRNGNRGNVESYDSASPGIINLDSDGYAFTVNEDCFDSATETVFISYDDVFSEIIDDFSDYECGVDIMTYSSKGNRDSALGCVDSQMKTRKIIFDSLENMTFELKKLFGDYTVHNILFWVKKKDGVKYTSRNAVFEYNIEESEYDAYIYDGTKPDYSYSSSIYDPTEYVLSGLSPDKNEKCTLNVIIPAGSTDVSLYMNSKPIGQTLIHSWCYNVSVGTPTDTEDNHIETINFSVKNNLPFIESDSSSTIETAKEYNADPGAQTQSGGCCLFDMLNAGEVPETSSRSVVFSVKYKTPEGTSVSSYYKAVQPGYKDKRLVPKVSLDINKSLISLENSNRSTNGVLCNQFQFFVDVNISDFTREAWGSYLNEDDIKLDIEIKNTEKDYEFIDKYTIQNAEDMYTFHINTDDTSTADFDSYNYVRIKTYPVSNSAYDPQNMTMKELDDASVWSSIDSSSFVTDTIKMKSTTIVDPTIDGERVKFNEDFKQCMSTNTRGSGLNDEICIQMNGIKFSDLDSGKKFRFRVVVEYGNPLFSRLFFRFYVSKLIVRYGNENSFILGGLETSNTTGTLSTKKYMYASETLNVFVCPISMTAVPRALWNEETTVPITIGYGKYIPKNLDTDISRAERNKRYVNQEMDWFDFMTLNRFFQDNVTSVSVSPLSVEYMSNVVSDSCPFVEAVINKPDGVEERTFNKSYKDLLGYLSLWYNTKGMTNMTIDMEMFEWPKGSGNELNALRYSQEANNAPIFTKQQLVSQIRDVRHENSVNFWNSVYQDTNETADGLFGGVMSTYGNGYMFLSSEYAGTDIGERDIYSLGDTMSLGDADVLAKYSDYDTVAFNEPDEYRATQPQDGKWYQNLLWIAAWQWPRYYVKNSVPYIDAYDIVPSG